jgi:hypothetical protein
MATALDEEKKKRTAFPTNLPESGRMARPKPPTGLGVVAPPSAPVIPNEVAGMASRPLVQSATSGAIANQQATTPTPRAPLDAQAAADRAAMTGMWDAGQAFNKNFKAGSDALRMAPAGGAAMLADTLVTRPLRAIGFDAPYMAPKVAQGMSAILQPAAAPQQAAQPQFQPGQRTQEQRNMPGASGELVRPVQPRVGLTAQQVPTIASRQAAPSTPMQQEGVDVGFGIRRLEGPGGTPLYTNIQPGAPIPEQPPQPLYRQPQAQRQEVVMPKINPRGGVFSSMADFVNQAGGAYGAIAKNKSIGKQEASMRDDAQIGLGMQRAGLDVLRTGDDMATSALTREAAQMGINKAKQIEALQQQWQAAGNDPAKQKAIAQQLAVLSGKGESGNLKDNFMMIGGEQQYDATGQRISDTPKMLIDLRTMQPVNAGALPGGQKAQQPYPEKTKLRNKETGEVEEVINGKPVPIK